MARHRWSWLAGLLALAALGYLAGSSQANPALEGALGAGEPPSDVPLVDHVRELFPQTEGWFRIVSGAEFEPGPEQRFLPKLETLTHPRVRWKDGSGHTVVAEFARSFRRATRIGSGENPDAWVEVVPESGRDVRATIQDGLVVYRGVHPDTHVLYKSTPTHVDEYLLLESHEAPTRWRYRVRRGPAIARLRQAGEAVEAVDAQGVAWLRGNQPWAVDRSGERVDGTLRVEGDVLVAEVDVSGLEPPILVDPDWKSTGDMSYGRFYHHANVLPDGRMLVTGGCSAAVCSGDLTLPACRSVVSAAEALDIGSRTFSRITDSAERRFFHVGESLASGDVLVAGGCTDSGCTTITDSAEVFEADADAFREVAPLPQAGAGMASALLSGGRVLVAGGCDLEGCTESAWVFDPEADGFTEVASMNEARGRATVTTLTDGRVLLAGGCTTIACAEVLSSAEVYDPEEDTWTATAPLSVRRAGHYAAPLAGGRVLIGGGCADQRCETIHDSAEIFEPASLELRPTGSQREPRIGALATALPDGRILVSQGCVSTTECNLTNELYTPSSGSFSMAAEAVTTRAFHDLVVHEDAQMIIANGGCQPRTCSWWNETWSLASIDPSADAGVPPMYDAGRHRPDGGTGVRDAGDGDAGDGFGASSGFGCDCRAAGATPPGGTALLLGLLGLLLRRRRRR